jgi:hypothetical protein
MKTYWQKLKDPRWQKRRLEILNKAEFSCELCGDGEQTLHVHHLIYDKGKDPWQYSDEWLACLCEACHEELHEAKALLQQATASLTPADLRRVAGYAFGLSAVSFEFLTKGLQVHPDASDNDSADGVYDAIRAWLPRNPDTPDLSECQITAFLEFGGTMQKGALWNAFHEALAVKRGAERNGSH